MIISTGLIYNAHFLKSCCFPPFLALFISFVGVLDLFVSSEHLGFFIVGHIKGYADEAIYQLYEVGGPDIVVSVHQG